jgi:hypothetical protein
VNTGVLCWAGELVIAFHRTGLTVSVQYQESAWTLRCRAQSITESGSTEGAGAAESSYKVSDIVRYKT